MKSVLAVVWTVLILHPYLQGKIFPERDDYCGLKLISNLADSMGRLARCRLWLPERTDYGAINPISNLADAMGRLVHWRFRFPKLEFDDIHRAVI